MKGAGPMESVSVLVVDDDEDTGALLGLCMDREGWKPTLVGSLAAARVALATGRYDVLLTDLHLPDGEGTELVLVRPAGLRVAILMSGSALAPASEPGAKARFDAVMSKPLERASVVNTIRTLLNRAVSA